jgi:hypothetical protein
MVRAVATNRVTPFGTIEALPGRGTLMGNRGCIHKGREIRRQWASRAWITCALQFKGWRAPMWEPNRWTALFFLDEATALAAGHRPCALCRRTDYNRFRAAYGMTDLETVDATLHRERTGRRWPTLSAAEVPDGVMACVDGRAWLVHEGSLRAWSSEGYGEPRPMPDTVAVLTPPSTVAAIRNGYTPALHGSAA